MVAVCGATARPLVSLLGRTDICPAVTLPTNPHPLVEFVKINRTGEHQQPCGYEFLTSPHAASEPGTGDGAGAFCSDVVAALRHLTKMID
jgi:hypothetical protein